MPLICDALSLVPLVDGVFQPQDVPHMGGVGRLDECLGRQDASHLRHIGRPKRGSAHASDCGAMSLVHMLDRWVLSSEAQWVGLTGGFGAKTPPVCDAVDLAR